MGSALLLSGLLVGSEPPPDRVVAAQTTPRTAVTYTQPVHGPVVDPFRPPETFAGPGNRGLEYGNPLFVPVVAAADGRVRFAGPVFGNGTVVIDHADGVRTTYNGLTDLWVGGGQQVRQLDGIGLAGTNVHFGALRGNVYLDPQILIDASDVETRARLVPIDRNAGPQ